MRSFRFGAPFVLFLIAGSYGMAEVLGLKYERMDQRVVKQSERQYELQQEHKVSCQARVIRFPSPQQLTTAPPCPPSGNDGAPVSA